MTRSVLAALVALLAAGCVVAPPEPARPVARKAPSDWFQQQLAEARQARASHAPKADAAGAQAEYDRIVHAACARVALSGPAIYQARCAAVLRPAPAAADPFPCDDADSDPAAIKACND